MSKHYWIYLGDTIRFTVTVTNRGPMAKVKLFNTYPSLILEMVTAPRGSHEHVVCGGDVVGATTNPHAGQCGPAASDLLVTLRSGETRTFTWTLRVVEIVCGGRGDFLAEFFGGVEGATKSRLSGYTEYVWVANDEDDYSTARTRYPAKPGHVTPACVV